MWKLTASERALKSDGGTKLETNFDGKPHDFIKNSLRHKLITNSPFLHYAIQLLCIVNVAYILQCPVCQFSHQI